jgi:hypothetical protein
VIDPVSIRETDRRIAVLKGLLAGGTLLDIERKPRFRSQAFGRLDNVELRDLSGESTEIPKVQREATTELRDRR